MKKYLYRILMKHALSRVWLLSFITAFAVFTESGAQNLQALGSGIKGDVHCGCSDSLGNLYVFADNRGRDSTVVWQWEKGLNAWSVNATSVKTLYSHGGFTPECAVYNTALYLTAITNPKGSGRSGFYRVTSDSLILIDTFQLTGPGRIRMLNFDHKLYLAGNFDSSSNKQRQITAYNGSGFVNTGFSAGSNFPAEMAEYNDTLLVTANNRVLFHVAPNTWNTFYTHDNVLSDIAVLAGKVYISDQAGKLLRIERNTVKESFASGKSSLRLKAYKNKLLIIHNRSAGDLSTRIGEYANQSGAYYVVNNLPDSNQTELVGNAVTDDLYYINRLGIYSSGRNYNHVARFRDTLAPLGWDSIFVRVFKDLNKNNVYDGPDRVSYAIIAEGTMNDTFVTDSFGQIMLQLLEDEDFKIWYVRDLFQPDSCYGQSYEGYFSANTYNSPLTSARLDIPLTTRTIIGRNLVLKGWSGSRARLLDTIPLIFDISSKDCQGTSSSASITIDLDSSTEYISSLPAYSSRIKSRFTYNLTDISSSSAGKIVIWVRYTNIKYKAGQFVRHQCALTTAFAEDTIDNKDSIVQKLVYSYDPNSKYSIPEGRVTDNLKTIRFHIDFQNLGTDNARRVMVMDSLNLNMPLYEFQMVASSHNYGKPSFNGSVVTWVFDNINLRPKSENEEASKGFIIFDARVMGNLREGDSIRNKAYIFFDYNEPVITNYSVITRRDPSDNVPGSKRNSALRIFPNPAADYMEIHNQYTVDQDIYIYDMKGCLIQKLNLEAVKTCRINTAAWARGIYLVVSSSGDVEKVCKE